MPMLHEGFAVWFRQELDRREWDQSDFARYANTSTANVSRWAGGVVPTTENIGLIADTYGIAPEVIYGVLRGDKAPLPRTLADISAELEANRPVEVPVLQNLAAHAGKDAPIEDVVYLPARFRRAKKQNIYGVIARGECMVPEIHPGDYIIFDEDAVYEQGDIVVAVVDGEVLVKRLVKMNGQFVLRGDADGSTVTFDDRDKIYGRVIFITRPK